jgi:hypothetical protein
VKRFLNFDGTIGDTFRRAAAWQIAGLNLVPRVGAGSSGDVVLAKFGVIIHDFMHQLFNYFLTDLGVLATRQFRHGLGNRVYHFVRIDRIRLASRCRMPSKEIIDQLDNQAMQARSILVFILLY